MKKKAALRLAKEMANMKRLKKERKRQSELWEGMSGSIGIGWGVRRNAHKRIKIPRYSPQQSVLQR